MKRRKNMNLKPIYFIIFIFIVLFKKIRFPLKILIYCESPIYHARLLNKTAASLVFIE